MTAFSKHLPLFIRHSGWERFCKTFPALLRHSGWNCFFKTFPALFKTLCVGLLLKDISRAHFQFFNNFYILTYFFIKQVNVLNTMIWWKKIDQNFTTGGPLPKILVKIYFNKSYQNGYHLVVILLEKLFFSYKSQNKILENIAIQKFIKGYLFTGFP